MSKKVVLVWFRNDLRLHDNEVLTEAIAKSDLIIPVYCFDPRYFHKNKFQFILKEKINIKELFIQTNH